MCPSLLSFFFSRKVAFDNLSYFRRHLQIYLQRVKFLFVWLTFYFVFNRFARDYRPSQVSAATGLAARRLLWLALRLA